tara:strand:- start:8825 stop:8998 length:174 start_codon:yes stop_codon:yes gene_type:complete
MPQFGGERVLLPAGALTTLTLTGTGIDNGANASKALYACKLVDTTTAVEVACHCILY